MSLTAVQIEARKRGVGCSEILAALGKDPRCSRLELYKRKVGELPEPDLSNDERVRFGNLLEDVVRQEFGRRIGQKIIVPQDTFFHESAPLLGHPDGWMPAISKGIEVKTADKFEADEFGEEESDQVPVRYLVQCTGYMAITNADSWHLAVLIGGNDLRTYEIPRDPQLEKAILVGVEQFWSHVEQRRPPDPGTPEDVRIRWPKDLGTEIVATPEVSDLCKQLAVAKKALKEAESTEANLKASVQRFMQENALLVDEDDVLLATWKKNRDSQVLDLDKLSMDEPEIYERYLRTRSGARPFLLKVKTED